MHELDQAEEEGRSLTAVNRIRADWEASRTGPSSAVRAAALLAELTQLPHPHGEQREPSDLDDIRDARSTPRATHVSAELSDALIQDRILGGWLGRAAGCLLGKPVEKATRSGIRAILESNGRWPLNDYFTAKDVPSELLIRYPWNRYGGIESLKENIVSMPEDDDLNYTMLNLDVAECFGFDFSSEDVLQTWLEKLPVLATFTAERVAYQNALELLTPPDTATTRNPYREWIGAQIRADVWGWLSPSQPARAAAMAWRDARVSHVKNGLYGAMFTAAALSTAFVAARPIEVVHAGLAQIPAKSRLGEAIRFSIGVASASKDWEEIVDSLHDRYGHYHWVHVINNCALLTAALIHGRGDFEETICAVVMGGWDTDSNGATAGAIIGTMIGAAEMPEKWTAPLQNRIRTSLKGFDNSAIDSLAARTAKLAIAGRIVSDANDRVRDDA